MSSKARKIFRLLFTLGLWIGVVRWITKPEVPQRQQRRVPEAPAQAPADAEPTDVEVEIADEDSFPASDPPGWIGSHV